MKKQYIVEIVLLVLGIYLLIYGICNPFRFADALALVLICCMALAIRYGRRKLKGILRKIINSVWYVGIVMFLICEACILTQKDDSRSRYSEADYIVVLGSQLENNQMTSVLQNRLDRAISLEEEIKVPIIVSGGFLNQNTISEAEVMREYLIEHKVCDAVYIETEAKDTRSNFELVWQKFGGDSIVIVTSDFHMFRAKMLAKRAGYETVYGVSSEIDIPDLIYYHLREVVAIVREWVRIF